MAYKKDIKPWLKENNLIKQQKEQEEKAEEERIAKEKEEYYWDHFDELMIQKIDKSEKLSERELRILVKENELESEWGENHRWTRSVCTIVKLCERYFAIIWEEGLTECQEDEFFEQPYEVEKKTYEKTITVTEWRKKQ